jgi:hypothetical protein
MSLAFVPYCTDEDLAVRACGDFGVLCPKGQTLANGADGVFASGSPWILTSASVDFNARGLQPGNVIYLTGPKPYFTGSGEPCAVTAVATGQVTLKGIGLDAGVGQPPGPSAGLSGVTFSCKTLQPQINSCCLEVNATFGLDPNLTLKSPALVYDPDLKLTSITVLTVLKRQYTFLARGKDGGDFREKLKEVSFDLTEVLARAQITFGALGESEAPKSLFSLRFRR